MRKLIVTEFLTLDGVMQDPGGSGEFDRGGWSFKFPDDEGMKFKLEETLACDALLLGRVTYEGFAAAWPTMTDEVGFADKMNSMPKYVVSTTLEAPTWNNSSVISANVAEEVAGLKQQAGREILVAGSRTLVHTLAEHDLVDEYRLMVHPIILGAGKRLFSESATETVLELVEFKALSSGTLILIYEPIRS